MDCFLHFAAAILSNVILHDNPTTGALVDSNAGHASSVIDGLGMMTRQPFWRWRRKYYGFGLAWRERSIDHREPVLVCCTGSWAGRDCYCLLGCLLRCCDGCGVIEVMLALGVQWCVGLGIIGLFLPVWADDTVSIVWWTFAAIAIGSGSMAQKEPPAL